VRSRRAGDQRRCDIRARGCLCSPIWDRPLLKHSVDADGNPTGSGATRCTECKIGRYSKYDRIRQMTYECAVCPDGTTTSGGATSPHECFCAPGAPRIPIKTTRQTIVAPDTLQSDLQSGYYAYSADKPCQRCAELVLPVRTPGNREALQALLAEPSTCPGGTAGTAAFISPLSGTWVHITDAGNAELIGCENAAACVSDEKEVREWLDAANNTHWRVAANESLQLRRHLGGACGEGYEGFLCRSCKDGYLKLGGKCIVCDKFDWRMLGQALVVLLMTALFLLHKSTRWDFTNRIISH
jgi:hypothetical protein